VYEFNVAPCVKAFGSFTDYREVAGWHLLRDEGGGGENVEG